jgi:hypothetical protein
MSTPLDDITIYYHGNLIKDEPFDNDFRRIANYVSDFYHSSLNGYKPPKTGRICIHFTHQLDNSVPKYFGSIRSHEKIIDEIKYLSLTKHEKHKYILELLHLAILEIASIDKWDKTVFENAYKIILENDFRFEKFYPEKKSLDRKYIAQPIVLKTEEKSILKISIKSEDLTANEILIEKRNWFWYDSIYNFAKACKWIDKNSFGIYKGDKNCFYSLTEHRIVNDLNITDEDF